MLRARSIYRAAGKYGSLTTRPGPVKPISLGPVEMNPLPAEGWRYYSDGRDLTPFGPACARREFAPDAPASAPSPLVQRLDASSSGPSS
jgi:hypothetical protein